LLAKGGRASRKRGTGKFNQSTLYAHMKISQGNPVVQLMYSNWKKRGE
jgi:hypothetical protein